ncbi:MAG: AlpA family transcriptional regulator [Proteobacteria bacterium]|nr:AlpA family transcriptional regulator [Pseudomonadota bacterium]
MHHRRIWRLPDVMAQTGLSRSTIYSFVNQKKFPAQIHLGPRSVGWVATEIEDWIEARIEESRERNRQPTDMRII